MGLAPHPLMAHGPYLPLSLAFSISSSIRASSARPYDIQGAFCPMAAPTRPHTIQFLGNAILHCVCNLKLAEFLPIHSRTVHESTLSLTRAADNFTYTHFFVDRGRTFGLIMVIMVIPITLHQLILMCHDLEELRVLTMDAQVFHTSKTFPKIYLFALHFTHEPIINHH